MFTRKQLHCKGGTVFSTRSVPLGGRSFLYSPHQSSPTQLHCVKTTPATTETQAPQRDWKSVWQHLPQQEIQKAGLSVQAPSSTNNDMLKVTTAVQQIMTGLGEAVSEKDKIIFITRKVHNLKKRNGC
jgi:hypothetical protein